MNTRKRLLSCCSSWLTILSCLLASGPADDLNLSLFWIPVTAERESEQDSPLSGGEGSALKLEEGQFATLAQRRHGRRKSSHLTSPRYETASLVPAGVKSRHSIEQPFRGNDHMATCNPPLRC